MPFNKEVKLNQYLKRPRGVMANVLDCRNVVSEFELQLRYYVPFMIIQFEKV